MKDVFAENIKSTLSAHFAKSSDFNLRELTTDGKKIYISFLACFSDRAYISENIIHPLVKHGKSINSKEELLSCIYASSVKETETVSDMEKSLRFPVRLQIERPG